MPTSSFDLLSGQVAVVTGGNGGIGHAIALGLAEAGPAAAILARNEEKNRAVLAELEVLKIPSLALRVNVADRAQLQPALELGRENTRADQHPREQRRDRNHQWRPRAVSRGMGQGDPNELECVLPALKACRPVDGQAKGGQDHQYRQRVLLVRIGDGSLLSAAKGGLIQTHQVDGD